jgi:hypothetical protein
MRPIAVACFALACLVLAAPLPALAEPRPETRTIRHWMAACDNRLDCSAFGFAVQLDETMTGAWIRIERAGGPEAAPSLEIGVALADGGGAGPSSVAIAVAGTDLPGGPFPLEQEDDYFSAAIPQSAAGPLLAALRKAPHVEARFAGAGTIDATISLDGAIAALRWIDERQGRSGTVTALIDRGRGPASSVPAGPPLPLVKAALPTKPVDDALPGAARRRLATDSCAEKPDAVDPIVGRLDGGRRLLGGSCGLGAYNFETRFFIETDGRLEPVHFRRPAGLEARAPDFDDTVLLNAFFDGASQTITAFAKGRGLGDCGEEADWTFDGTAFRLTRLAAMPECEGVPSGAWPSLYRARIETAGG